MPTIAELMQELADLRSGIPVHVHTDTSGRGWRCTSPYCDRGNDIRDQPAVAPNAQDALGDRARYRRPSDA